MSVRAAALLAALLLAAPAIPAAHALPDPGQAALDRAVAYLQGQADKSDAYLVEAVIGAGLDPGLWPTPASDILDRLAVPAVGTPGNDPIREIHAVAQSGYDPRHFQGRDLVAELKAEWPVSQQGVGQAAFTLLGLHAAGVPDDDPTIQETMTLLQRGQFANGGWSCWGLPSPDCTGFALVALAAAHGFLPGTAERARLWLDANRLANGGYASGGHIGSLTVAGAAVPTEGANTQSTIWAVNGYRAIGDPAPAASMAYLLSRQMPDGGFAWRDVDTASDPWSTTEVVAGWRQAFNQLPTFAPATVTAPAAATVGLPATYAVPGFDEATWLSGASTLAGPAVQFTFPATGPAAVHLDARRAGAHHRETVATAVGNAAPVFTGLPAEVTAPRHQELRLDPAATDPDGHAVTVTWTFDGQSGTGAVALTPTRRGDFPLSLTATDAYGAATTATVLVHIVK